MPPSSVLSLAARLREFDDERLLTLLRTRDIRSSSIKDFFDLADRLLDPTTIHPALMALDRPTLLALWRLSESGTPLSPDAALLLGDLALVSTSETDAEPYDPVTETLHGWPAIGLPSLAELDEPAPAALEPVSTVDAAFTNHLAAERAFTTTISALELVTELWRAPARELVRGGIALPDSKRLAGATNLSFDEVAALLAVCASAGLITLGGGEWQPSESARAWRNGSTVRRWALLAGGWFDAVPGDIRDLLSERAHAIWGERLADYIRWLYPASVNVSARLDEQVTAAELLGITANGAPSAPGSALLIGDVQQAIDTMRGLFPTEVTSAYLQHDLTIVSPGPLEASLDAQLRELAEVESSGLATTFRVSAASLDRAIGAGATADSIRAFLQSISLTGIPQPLEYLIAETARRHGLVRVGRTERGSYVHSTDDNLLHTIAVDSRLAALGLRGGEDGLESNYDEELVFWALSDARYPVAAEDADGGIITLDRRRAPRAPTTTVDPVTAIVARLRDSADRSSGTDRDWLERQLDVAIKSRATISVEVNLPNGESITYQLEPTGLGGGRLRARDRKADIERTIPLSSIAGVGHAD